MSIDGLLKVILLACKVLLAAYLFGMIIRTFSYQEKQRRKALALFRRTRQPAGSGGAFLVRYASADSFEASSKIVAGSGFGLLSVEASAVVFRGELFGGTPSELTFPHQSAVAAWVGRRWSNGFFSWFVITRGAEKHYFTSAEGYGVLRSKSRTRRVYDEVVKSLAGERGLGAATLAQVNLRMSEGGK